MDPLPQNDQQLKHERPKIVQGPQVDHCMLGLALGNFGSPGTAGNTRLPAVPLPPAAALMLGGLGSLVAFARRRSPDRYAHDTTAA